MDPELFGYLALPQQYLLEKPGLRGGKCGCVQNLAILSQITFRSSQVSLVSKSVLSSKQCCNTLGAIC
jgi:hypothetical protein